jgi:hypothetical protein
MLAGRYDEQRFVICPSLAKGMYDTTLLPGSTTKPLEQETPILQCLRLPRLDPTASAPRLLARSKQEMEPKRLQVTLESAT